jgi:hypothetical protein
MSEVPTDFQQLVQSIYAGYAGDNIYTASKETQVSGLKYDLGKPMMELIDADFELDLARVLTNGANKYDAENWRKGIAFKRLIGAAKRHINAIERGEDIDPEWNLLHTAHAACELMFLHWMIKNRPDLDDRSGK